MKRHTLRFRAVDRDDLMRMYHGFPGYEEKLREHGILALTFVPV